MPRRGRSGTAEARTDGVAQDQTHDGRHGSRRAPSGCQSRPSGGSQSKTTTAKSPTIASARPSAPSVPSNAAPTLTGQERKGERAPHRLNVDGSGRVQLPEHVRDVARCRHPRPASSARTGGRCAAGWRAGRRPRRWRPLVLAERPVLAVADDADDLRQDSRLRSDPADERGRRADRVREVAAPELLVDDDHGRRAALICRRGTRAPSRGRCPCVEVAGTDEVVLVLRPGIPPALPSTVSSAPVVMPLRRVRGAPNA